jgi:hypothetical protein
MAFISIVGPLIKDFWISTIFSNKNKIVNDYVKNFFNKYFFYSNEIEMKISQLPTLKKHSMF